MKQENHERVNEIIEELRYKESCINDNKAAIKDDTIDYSIIFYMKNNCPYSIKIDADKSILNTLMELQIKKIESEIAELKKELETL